MELIGCCGDLDEAGIVAEKIRLYISEQTFNYKDSSLMISITIGVAQHQAGENLDTVSKRADEAMYRGKESGRNCVRV